MFACSYQRIMFMTSTSLMACHFLTICFWYAFPSAKSVTNVFKTKKRGLILARSKWQYFARNWWQSHIALEYVENPQPGFYRSQITLSAAWHRIICYVYVVIFIISCVWILSCTHGFAANSELLQAAGISLLNINVCCFLDVRVSYYRITDWCKSSKHRWQIP